MPKSHVALIHNSDVKLIVEFTIVDMQSTIHRTQEIYKARLQIANPIKSCKLENPGSDIHRIIANFFTIVYVSPFTVTEM